MRVTLDHSTIEAFKRNFPCNGLPELQSITFEYASNGDLVDIVAYDADGHYIDSSSFDGQGLLALSLDYQPTTFRDVGLGPIGRC